MPQAIQDINTQQKKEIARAISLVENESAGYDKILSNLQISDTPVIGITGAPGAGKSTITNSLIAHIVTLNKKVAVLCIDPSSPFNLGAILGDRIRMSEWYNNENVFIRSIATRGALGGLSHKVIEITDLLKGSGFDFIIIETVGIGQSEIDIAGLADVTAVVVVPEGGDDVQAMKSGVMEVADIFILNKADRSGAENSMRYLQQMISPGEKEQERTPIIKMVATKDEGVADFFKAILEELKNENAGKRKKHLLAEKAWQLLVAEKMRLIDKKQFQQALNDASTNNNFNLYKFISEY